jgi:Tfp pilus assembly protein PilX
MRALRQSDERGIALAVAVFALVVIAALVAGTFFAGRLEQQTGMNTFFAAQAAEAAEAGLNDALATQTAGAMTALPIDPAVQTDLGTFAMGNKVSASRTISRLTDNLFLLRSSASRVDAAGGQLAARTLGQLIRLEAAEIDVQAGLTALGDVKITGGAEVTGSDEAPPDLAAKGVACPPVEDVSGVR